MAHGHQEAAASPRPAAPIATTDHSYEALVKLHEIGILSKEEVREIVFQKLQKARKLVERQAPKIATVPKCKRQVIQPAQQKTPPVPTLPKTPPAVENKKPKKRLTIKRKPADEKKKK